MHMVCTHLQGWALGREACDPAGACGALSPPRSPPVPAWTSSATPRGGWGPKEAGSSCTICWVMGENIFHSCASSGCLSVKRFRYFFF